MIDLLEVYQPDLSFLGKVLTIVSKRIVSIDEVVNVVDLDESEVYAVVEGDSGQLVRIMQSDIDCGPAFRGHFVRVYRIGGKFRGVVTDGVNDND